MSDQVGVMYADDRAEAGGAGLSRRRLASNDGPMKAHVLIDDADGRLVIDGSDLSVRQHAFALIVPEVQPASGTTLAALVDSEIQRILSEGYEMAHHMSVLKNSTNEFREMRTVVVCCRNVANLR